MESCRLLDTARASCAVAALLASALLGASEADLSYTRGMEFAQTGDWHSARVEFLRGAAIERTDKRFPLELAGVAFRQKRYEEAIHWLRAARRLDATDPYVSDFLATCYFLLGNTDAAVHHWNPSGKPKIANVRIHRVRTDPVLLDRAFQFAPSSTLSENDLAASRARVHQLGVFVNPAFRLDARADGDFDLTFSARERNGFGDSRLQSVVSAMRGIAYQAVHLDYFNIGDSTTNVASMLRWDRYKRRLFSSVSGPLRSHRYGLSVDARDEEWDVGGIFNLRKIATHAELTTMSKGTWSFTTGAELSHRTIASMSGFQLKHIAAVTGDLLRVPDRRLRATFQASAETGRAWVGAARLFERLETGVTARWFPRMRGDDYAVTTVIRSGAILGSPPFDELFILGVERDNDLWLRAHVGTRAGRKGSAPMTTRYVLLNSEIDKNLYSNGLISVKLAPFFDVGRGFRTQWMFDTGAQIKLRVFGVGLSVLYGKDLRSGRNAFYLTALP